MKKKLNKIKWNNLKIHIIFNNNIINYNEDKLTNKILNNNNNNNNNNIENFNEMILIQFYFDGYW